MQVIRQNFNYWTASTWEKYQKGEINILLTNEIIPWYVSQTQDFTISIKPFKNIAFLHLRLKA